MRDALLKRISELRLNDAKIVPEDELKETLKLYGVPVPRGRLCKTAEDAATFSLEIGFPVVLKLSSDIILHKTEIKGVRLNLGSKEEVGRAFEEMDSSFKKQNIEGYLGILVEKQAPPGIELIIGLQHDASFGPVIMMGLGGIFTDLLNDVVFRMIPLSKKEILEALRTLNAWPLFTGYRGKPALALDKIVEVIHAISTFGADFAGQYESVDFNPLIATSDDCTVVDAKMVIAAKEMPAQTSASEMPRTGHLAGFFNPKSVAVIGASNTPGKIGFTILDSLINLNFKGSVYPVNPKADEVLGLKAYPSLSALPETPEMVAISVGLELVPDIISEMGKIGAHNAFIVSGGGRELGGDRADIETRISLLARENDVRIVGPNCIGSFDGNNKFDSFFYPRERLKRPGGGPMSFITQSGTWGCAFLENAAETGVSKMVSYGNRVDVDEGDLIAYLATDPDTKVIGSYLEGLGDGRKFLEGVKTARDAGKPVVVFKTGRNRMSANASVSHTGAYGGSYEIYKGALEQGGVILTDSFHELYAACAALALQTSAKGNRVALVSNGAGPMVNAIDLFPMKGLELIKLGRESFGRMREKFSFFYIVENPVDVTGSATGADYEFVIETLFADDSVDIIMPFFVFQNAPLDESIIERLAALNAKKLKPIVCCSTGGIYSEKMGSTIMKAGIPVFTRVSEWVAAASALAQWARINKKT